MKPRAFLPLFVLAAHACGGDPEPARRVPVNVADSIRTRRTMGLGARPDTLGIRVDSLRAMGRTDARLWIVVVSDFQCADCARLALEVLPAIRREYVDSGAVRLAFVNAPQDEHFNARFAAHAALCAAAAGRFWAMHDSLFATQPIWHRRDDPQPYFDSLAVSAGVSADAQSDCTRRQRLLNLLREDIERARAAGVTEVPSVFVGDRLLSRGDLTLRGMRRAIEQATGARR